MTKPLRYNVLPGTKDGYLVYDNKKGVAICKTYMLSNARLICSSLNFTNDWTVIEIQDVNSNEKRT